MKFYRYDDAPYNAVAPGSENKMVHTEHMSLVTWRFAKGMRGAAHAHPQEQISYVLKGCMEFTTDSGTVTAKVGDQVVFAGNEAHSSVALEDSLVVDIFSSVREDFVERFPAVQPEKLG